MTTTEARETMTAMIDDPTDEQISDFRAWVGLMAEVAEAGDQISYPAADQLGDLVWDEFARGLSARGLSVSREDTDFIEIVSA